MLSVEEMLLARSVRHGSCLRWTGAHSQKGYGHIAINRKPRQVHRVAYETWIGPIPDGLEIDHVANNGCAFRDCIEPKHLEAVTHAENMARITPSTHCPRGHEFTPENTIIPKAARGRRCRLCKSASQKAYKARIRSQNA